MKPAKTLSINHNIQPTLNITIFASPKQFQNHIATIQSNAITSWIKLQPKPEIILCGNELGTAEIAQKFHLRHLPNIKCNENGTPLVSDIFTQVNLKATNKILVYLNSDIILTRDFIPTIQQVASQYQKFLIVGRRWNLDLREKLNFDDVDWEEKLSDRLQKFGIFSGVGALDYFVFPKPLFSQLPKFAIGRPGWDNWMVGEALKNNYPVINGSLVIKPIHQNHDYNHLRGKRTEVFQGVEARENQQLLRGSFAGNSANATHYLTPIIPGTNPRVSIIVTTEKPGINFDKTLTSISNQTYKDYEIIVVSKNPVNHQNLPSLKSLQPTQPGIVNAYNQGLENARGEFISFIDAENYLLPEKLRLEVNCFDSHACSLEMVLSGWQIINSQGKVTAEIQPWHELGKVLKGREGLHGLHIWMLPTLWRLIHLNSMMFRRSWLEFCGGFNSELSEMGAILDLVLNLSVRGGAGFCLEIPTFCSGKFQIKEGDKIREVARDGERLLEIFFAKPYLMEWMSYLRPRAYYQTLVWLGWLMYRVGEYSLMVEYLQRSLSYAEYSPMETVFKWVESFGRFAEENGESFDAEILINSVGWEKLISRILVRV